MTLFLSVICISSLHAAKMTIAVLDLKGKGVPEAAAQSVSDIIRSEFVNIENFMVVERSAMDEILKEQGLQQTGCTDASCAVQMGKLLSAQKIIVGEMNKIGKAVLLTLRIIDVEKGVSEYSSRDKASAIENVDEAAIKISRKLTQRIVSGEKEFFSPLTPLGYYSRSLVPGWGQIYAGHTVKGSIVAGGFVASWLVVGLAYYNYSLKKDAYDSEPLSSGNFSKRRDEYDTAGKLFDYSFIVVGAVYVLHWVDVIFFSKPEFSSVSAGSDFNRNRFGAGYIYSIVPKAVPYNETEFRMGAVWRF